MAFLGGYLSPGLTAATNAVGSYQGAEADATKAKTAQVAQQIALLRQQHNDEITNALKVAQSGAASRRGAIMRGPGGQLVDISDPEHATPVGPAPTTKGDRTPRAFSVGGKGVEGTVDKEGNFYDANGVKVTGPIAPFTPPHSDPVQIISGTDPATGLPKVFRVPKSAGDATEVGGIAPKPGAAGGSATAQGQQARLLAAVSEARAAMPRMEAYENKMLANPDKATPSLLTQIGGKAATRLAGQHSATGIIGETLGEAVTDPEYLQYMRDAGLMARATQLMSSRGGSEAMVASEQLLNRAVANPNGLAGSVAAARKSRNAVFGRFGGLMQALSPAQAAKVEAGLAAMERGETNSPAVEEARAAIAGVEAGGAPAGAPAPSHPAGHAPSHAQQLWDAAVVKHGEAKVLAEYGPRPQEEE